MRITISGANVRPGFPSTITLTATNIGTLAINATVNLSLDSMFTITNTLPAAASSTNTTATWNINNFQPMQYQNFSISVLTSGLAIVGDTLHSSAEILPSVTDTVPADNFDEQPQYVVNSCDPNDKVVSPNDFITQAQVTNGLYLEYTINFQNTGTAPAINISIVDTLDANFVIPSFEVLSASHAYTWTISGQGIITFTFANIYLPDSGANEPASHGFIKYRLRPSTNFTTYVKLTNTAYIYFDNNAPIQTNYTSTRVYNTTGIIKTENGNTIFIYPNPSKGKISIASSDKSVNEMQVSLYSVIGNKVFEKKIKNTEANETVELNNLSKGIYFVKVIANNKPYQQKIVLE